MSCRWKNVSAARHTRSCSSERPGTQMSGILKCGNLGDQPLLSWRGRLCVISCEHSSISGLLSVSPFGQPKYIAVPIISTQKISQRRTLHRSLDFPGIQTHRKRKNKKLGTQTCGERENNGGKLTIKLSRHNSHNVSPEDILKIHNAAQTH